MPKRCTQSGPFTEYSYWSTTIKQAERNNRRSVLSKMGIKDVFKKGQNDFINIPEEDDWFYQKTFMAIWQRSIHFRSTSQALWCCETLFLPFWLQQFTVSSHYFHQHSRPRAPLLWPMHSPLKPRSLLLNRILQQQEYTTKSVYTVRVTFLHFPVFLANLCSTTNCFWGVLHSPFV